MSRFVRFKTLRKRIAVTAVVASLGYPPLASAQDVRTEARQSPFHLRESIAREAASLAATQTITKGAGKNPYLIPAIGLMAGGGVLALWGFHSTDFCEGFSFECKERNSTYFGLIGLGVVGTGAWVFLRGESYKERRFGIDVSPTSIKMRVRFP